MYKHKDYLKELEGYKIIKGVSKAVEGIEFSDFEGFKCALNILGVDSVLIAEHYTNLEELQTTPDKLIKLFSSHEYRPYGEPEELCDTFKEVIEKYNRGIESLVKTELKLDFDEPVITLYMFSYNGLAYLYEHLNNPDVMYYLDLADDAFKLYLDTHIIENRADLLELQTEQQKQQLAERLAEMDAQYNIYKGSVDRLTTYIYDDTKFKAKKNQELRSDYLLNLVREDYEDLLPLFFKVNQITGPNSQSVLITNYGRQYIDGLYEEVKQRP